MKLTYTVEDDYGVVAAGADVKRDRSAEKPVDPKKAWAQPEAAEGPAPAAASARRKSRCACRAPRRRKAQTYIDFGPHP